ncbi:hypothetical protein IW262DRAFT_1520709 [Armillaria fumosa]|nr:hypothetical protein IW262DRAFT_1520709 [Armillaria fumosa]
MHPQELTSAVDTEGESDCISEQAWDYDDEDHCSSEYNTDEEDTNFRKITLTSFTETGQDESTIPVLSQRSYTGRKVIPSALANTLCVDLGVTGVLDELNTMLSTSYNLDDVISILNSYIAQNVDFGTAYAYLRPYWNDIPTIEDKLRTQKVEDMVMRLNVLADGRITTRHLYPRRVWDLYANRVVPYWVAGDDPWAISHAWVDEKDRVDVITPINGCEWPVPMPKDANLDLIRIEMLNTRSKRLPRFEVEYIWLDVLCLRQEGGKGEHLRLEEWKLDVPTIGSVYERAYSHVIYYFNGLGRPLDLTPGYFESDRCWFRRAWTLQEITEYPAIIGGKTGKDVMDKQVQMRFDEQLASLQELRRSPSILDLVSEMKHRVSTKPLDKVAGLVYLLRMGSIPIYDTKQSAADAWEILVDVMHPWCRAELLFVYPEPGNGSKYWRPSWDQVMMNKAIVPHFTRYLRSVCRTNNPDMDYYKGHYTKSGNVQGLSKVPKEVKPREGELVINSSTMAPYTLKILVDHTYPIPDGLYTLIGWRGIMSGSQLWVVGQLTEDGMFKKLSVFRTVDNEQLGLRQLRLQKTKMILC